MNATVINLPQFQKAMDDYLAVTRRTADEAFAKQAKELAYDLYLQFKALKPGADAIENAAVARGWAVKRRGDALTPAARYGVSKKAFHLAEDMMDNQKSNLFKVTRFGVYPARFGASGKLLKAGRRGGNEWRMHGRSFSALKDRAIETLAETGLPDDVKRLNITAVARSLEIKFRKRSGMGGFMAQQWLPEVWRRRNKQWVLTTGTSTAKDRRNRPIGAVTVNRVGGEMHAAIAGAIPGTAELSARTGAGDRAIAARVADIYTYVNRKLEASLK